MFPKLLLFVSFFVTCISVSAQFLQRESISSTGNAVYSEGTLIRQTIGQPYSTQTTYANGISFQPGFQQPIYSVISDKSDLSLTIYPNPAVFFVNIESPTVIEDLSFTIVDNMGRLISKMDFNHFKNYQLDCSSLSNGLYIINITAGNKYFSAKLVVNQ